MWSLRAAAKRPTVRSRTLRSATVGAFFTNLELPTNNTEGKCYSTCHPIYVIDHPKKTTATRSFSSPTLFLHSRNLSSQIDTKSGDKESEELEGFSDLDSISEENDVDNELVPECDDEEDNTLEAEEELIEKSSVSKRRGELLFELISSSPRHTMESSLEKWVKEGNEIQREDVIKALWRLRKFKSYRKALQFMDWLKKSELYEFTELEYSSLLDLNAKAYGLYQAEKFIEKVPQSLRTEHVYRTLLASCVYAMNVQKAEQTFNKMRVLNFHLTSFACNQLLLLYKRADKRKISDVLLMMKKENVKPTLFTYKMLIDTKGIVEDIPAMEQLLDAMKEDGVQPDIHIKHLVAKHYVKSGATEKAEKIAKEMEGEHLSNNIKARWFLLTLYAELGKPDDVERVWEACGVKPTTYECSAVIWAWAKLGNVEHAEKVFDGVSKKYKRVPLRCYNNLLKMYGDNKMVDKAKELVTRMSDEGIIIGREALDTLIGLYVEEGAVAKADSMVQNWVQKNPKLQLRPMYRTYMALLEAYAKKGDYHNAEKVVHLVRKMGYARGLRMYEVLLGAYVNAHVPAYGFRDRLRADNIFPGKVISEQLMVVNPFKKAPVTNMLQ